ncbi:MAG: PD-(D/E)XK nuclease family protein [Dehalococcoidia bacterium]
MLDRTDLFPEPRIVVPAQPPERWSYSSFRSAETCPRRWSLERSRFEFGRGFDVQRYPKSVYYGTLRGTVVHESIDYLANNLRRRGIGSVHDPKARRVLQELGGLHRVVEVVAERELRELEENPRATPHRRSYSARLQRDLREVAAEVKRALLRTAISARAATSTLTKTYGEGTSTSEALHDGEWSEVELRPSGFAWRGIADHIAVEGDSVTISDYKTGEPDPSHRNQVELYALLWREDNAKNPRLTCAERLRVCYTGSGRMEEFPGPTQDRLDELKTELVDKAAAVRESISSSPAEARPSADACRFCGMRQLCPEYWGSGIRRSDDPTWGADLRVELLERVSSGLWEVSVTKAAHILPGTPMRMRVPEDYSHLLTPGMEIVALDYSIAGIIEDGDGVRLEDDGFLSPTANSELFAPPQVV